ncbi:MAG: Gfo/Idh/MocA family oxidoreductase [Chitinophagaceae bacterium]|jgi:predicted dehydrogenase|nr:Gfo/Idh/MocA family oxidoreductase [Chitinophagaceae bacterium]
MHILLIGIGSIGKRHLANILHLGFSNIILVSQSGNIPPAFKKFVTYRTIQDALNNHHFEAAIICTPTAMHITALKILLEHNIFNIYVEKPISNSFDSLDEIKRLIDIKKARVQVGFDLHYDLGLQKVKQLIQENTIGKILSANAQVGQYLPDWRPNEDYRNGMSAKTSTGGGVLLDLIHEFDYLIWLLGNPKTVVSFISNSKTLEIETEDIAEVLIKFDNGILATIHLDYLQQKLVRNCLITGSNGTIHWNLVQNKVTWILANKTEYEYDYTGFERNDRFLNIMKDFLLKHNNEKVTLFNEGLVSLNTVIAAKYSSEKCVLVQLD